MGTRFALCASLLALGLVSSARANLLTNGSLEKDPSTPLDQYGMVTATPVSNSSAITGWTVVSGSVDVVPSSYWQVSNGTYSVDLVGTTGLGAIAQIVTTTAATDYSFTFDLSANPQNGPFTESVTTKRLLVEALAANGTTVLASQIFSIGVGTRTISNMQYLSNSLDFTATGTTTTIRLTALTPSSLPNGATDSTIRTGPVVDNLNLIIGGGSIPSPEPTSLSLLGVSASALLLRRRRGR